MDYPKKLFLTWILCFVSAIFADNIHGVPGIDYPNYTTVPKTSFKCSHQKKIAGFYADFEADCQVFHHCFKNRQKSYLCAAGTIFNQEKQTCDYWYNTKCEPLSTNTKKKEKIISKNEPFVEAQRKSSNVFDKMVALYEPNEKFAGHNSFVNQKLDGASERKSKTSKPLSQNFVELDKNTLSSMSLKDSRKNKVEISNHSDAEFGDIRSKGVDIILSSDDSSAKNNNDKSRDHFYKFLDVKSNNSSKKINIVDPVVKSNNLGKVKNSKNLTKQISDQSKLFDQLNNKFQFGSGFQQRSSNSESLDKKRKLRRRPTYVVLQTEADELPLTKNSDEETLSKISYSSIHKANEVTAESDAEFTESGIKSSSKSKRNRKPLEVVKAGNDDIEETKTTDNEETDPFIPGNIMTPFVDNAEFNSKRPKRRPDAIDQTVEKHGNSAKISEILHNDGSNSNSNQRFEHENSNVENPNEETGHVMGHLSHANNENEVVQQTEAEMFSSKPNGDIKSDKAVLEKEESVGDHYVISGSNSEYESLEENFSPHSNEAEYEWVLNPEYHQYAHSEDFPQESQHSMYETSDESDSNSRWAEHYSEHEEHFPSSNNREYISYYDSSLMTNGDDSEMSYEMASINKDSFGSNDEFEEHSQTNWDENSNLGNWESEYFKDSEEAKIDLENEKQSNEYSLGFSHAHNQDPLKNSDEIIIDANYDPEENNNKHTHFHLEDVPMSDSYFNQKSKFPVLSVTDGSRINHTNTTKNNNKFEKNHPVNKSFSETETLFSELNQTITENSININEHSHLKNNSSKAKEQDEDPTEISDGVVDESLKNQQPTLSNENHSGDESGKMFQEIQNTSNSNVDSDKLIAEKLKSTVRESKAKPVDSAEETDIQENQVFHPNSIALPTNDFEKNLYLKNFDSAQKKPHATLHNSGIFPTTFYKDINAGTEHKSEPSSTQKSTQKADFLKLKSNFMQMKRSFNTLTFADPFKAPPKPVQRSGSIKPADSTTQTKTSGWITNLKSLIPGFEAKTKLSRSGKPFKKFKPPKMLRLLMFGQKLLKMKQAKIDLLKSFLPFRSDN